MVHEQLVLSPAHNRQACQYEQMSVHNQVRSKRKKLKAELPHGNMFVISLKGVGPTNPIKEDCGSSTLTARPPAAFYCSRDTRSLFRYMLINGK
jgi:hypothetical protein